MIGYISGIVEFSKNQLSVISTNTGMGYEIKTSGPLNVGEEVKMFIYHSISENDQTLWGFSSPKDRELFKLLLTVNKVGPSKAYPLVMTLGKQNLITGIIHEDIAILTKAPGIGKKMAEQIILSLKDKIKDFALDSETDMTKVLQPQGDNKIIAEATQALVSLGYKDKDVTGVIKKNYSEAITKSEDLIKLVLKEL